MEEYEQETDAELNHFIEIINNLTYKLRQSKNQNLDVECSISDCLRYKLFIDGEYSRFCGRICLNKYNELLELNGADICTIATCKMRIDILNGHTTFCSNKCFDRAAYITTDYDMREALSLINYQCEEVTCTNIRAVVNGSIFSFCSPGCMIYQRQYFALHIGVPICRCGVKFCVIDNETGETLDYCGACYISQCKKKKVLDEIDPVGVCLAQILNCY